MARLILGKHPAGATGLFISRPGVAVESTSPDDTTDLLFSTNWGSVLSILHTGTCQLNDAVILPNVGFRPFVRWEAQIGSGTTATYNAYPGIGATQNTNNVNETRRIDCTRYAVFYDSDTQFRIAKKFPSFDTGTTDAGQVFRFVAFNIPANA